MGKFFKLRSDMLYLVFADGVTRRLLVLAGTRPVNRVVAAAAELS